METEIAIITGASSGIGAATAKSIAKEFPVTLFLIGRRIDRLEALRDFIGKERCKVFPIDVRDKNAINHFVKTEESSLKNVNVLINNAGLASGFDFFQDANIDDFDQMIDTNIKGLLYFTKAILPFMLKRKRGHIVNLGSVAGHAVYPRGHVYNATKFAVRALNEALRLDTLGSGIRVTCIDPGMVETEFSLVRFKGNHEKANAVYHGVKPLAAEDIAEAITWSLNRPPHVNIQEILILPTDQASARDVFRK